MKPKKFLLLLILVMSSLNYLGNTGVILKNGEELFVGELKTDDRARCFHAGVLREYRVTSSYWYVVVIVNFKWNRVHEGVFV